MAADTKRGLNLGISNSADAVASRGEALGSSFLAAHILPVTGVHELDRWLSVPTSGVRDLRRNSAGTQGNGVRTLETGDGYTVVVKWNHAHPEWPREEVAWQRRLTQTPLGRFIPRVLAETHGGFVMEHVPGEDVRDLVARGVSAKKVKVALNQVLTENERWVKQQQAEGAPHINRATNTVQRRQVQDTVDRLHGPLQTKLQSDVRLRNLFPEEGGLYGRPFVYNGLEFRSISEIAGSIMDHLRSEVPTYTLHGDISGNLRYDPRGGTVALLDPEFAGATPLSEDLVRIAKWRTTKLIQSCIITATSNTDGKLGVDVDTRFPENAEELHEDMGREAKEFMYRVGEGHAWPLYYLALAGSYLREAVLSIDRGTTDIAMWAFGEMATAHQIYTDLSRAPAREQRIA